MLVVKSLIDRINFWSPGLFLILTIMFEFRSYKIITRVLVDVIFFLSKD